MKDSGRSRDGDVGIVRVGWAGRVDFQFWVWRAVDKNGNSLC